MGGRKNTNIIDSTWREYLKPKKKKKHSTMLHPIAGPVRRPEFGVVDLESKDGDSQKGGFTRPFMVGYYEGAGHPKIFHGPQCLEEMIHFLLSPERDGMTYYAHNGGGFDWLHFLPLLTACGYYFEISCVSSKIQCIKVKNHKDSHRKGWTFLDSMQLMPAGLGKLTVAFGTEVQKDSDFDYDIHEDDPRWLHYLRADLISLYQTLMSFYELVEDYLGGEVGMTTAATAMKTFRRTYQEFPIERHIDHHEFFRKAYYGGRVEIYRDEMKGLNYYDINSSYPYSMLGTMPVGDLKEWHGAPAGWLLDGYIGFAHASVKVPEDIHCPILPFRTKDGKLIFPTGEFEGHWAAVELLAAEEQGATVCWLESKWIESRPIFENMIEKLYSLRDKNSPNYNEALSYVAKIMMNSLYGKFATNTEKEKIIFAPLDFPIPCGATPLDPDDPDCTIFRLKEEIDADYIIPQIAAHITALSRLQLHKFMSPGIEGGELAYCDTDGFLTTANLDHICGTGLGALKDEGDGRVYHGTFLQPKLYYLEGRDGIKLPAGEHKIPKWALAFESKGLVLFSDGEAIPIDPDEPDAIPHRKLNEEKFSKAKTVTVGQGGYIEFIERKAVMKGYRNRTKEAFDTIKLGGTLSYESLTKIGWMVDKGFKCGPRMLTVKRAMRNDDVKRIHFKDGTTKAVVLPCEGYD